MYTNGLKDRFGSPLISKRDLDKSLNETLIQYSTDSQKYFLKESDITADKNGWRYIEDNTIIDNAGEVLLKFNSGKTYVAQGHTNQLLNLGHWSASDTFDNLRILEGQDTFIDWNPDRGWPNLYKTCFRFDELERANNTYFNCVGVWHVDFPQLYEANHLFGYRNAGTENEKGYAWQIYGDFPSLTVGESLFEGTTNLREVKVSMPLLLTGTNAFKNCKNLRIFVGDLTNLVTGVGMFENTCLDVDSVRRIAKGVRNLKRWEKRLGDTGVQLKPNLLRYDENGKPVYYDGYKLITPEEACKMTITWSSFSHLTQNEKATILYELFPIMHNKGWDVITNLTEEEVLSED